MNRCENFRKTFGFWRKFFVWNSFGAGFWAFRIQSSVVSR